MDSGLIILYTAIGVVGLYLFSRIKVMGEENYMIVHRKGVIIREQYGGIVFLIPFMDSITILSNLVQPLQVETILFHEELYLGLNADIKWQIINPKDVFIGFDLQYKKHNLRIVGTELVQTLVSIFKYITVGSDMEKTIADTQVLTKELKEEMDEILAKKGIILHRFEIISINKIEAVEFQKIKTKYKRLNLRKHDSDKEWLAETTQHKVGNAEAYMRGLWNT